MEEGEAYEAVLFDFKIFKLDGNDIL